MRINFSMNPYLFGCGILFAWWLLVFIIVRTRGTARNRHEFWWGSLGCGLLGFTEPLFVPESWDPPSVLAYHRWDLESFVFCFFVGGIGGVAPEWRPLRKVFQSIDYGIWMLSHQVYKLYQRLTGAEPLRASSDIEASHDDIRRDNALLGAIFLGGFGFTAHLGLNVIYDAALTCLLVGAYIAWYRPRLRWQVWAGGLIFTVIYATVLFLTGLRVSNLLRRLLEPDGVVRHSDWTRAAGGVHIRLCDGSILGAALRVMAQRTPVTGRAAP